MPVSINAGQIPDKPVVSRTVVTGSTVTIEWAAPNNRGSVITSYTITIRQSDNVTFTETLTDCDGRNTAIVSSTSCQVPIAKLRTAPYNLPWGASIFAKVVATNFYGSSAVSDPVNGAIILTIPDAPKGIIENYSLKSGTTISLAWINGDKDGGAPVTSYNIRYNSDGSSVYAPLVAGLLVKSYTASNLTPGVTYNFVVTSTNVFGTSLDSSVFSSLCAWVPFKPDPPTTNVIGNRLQIIWTAPFDNGSQLTKYMILIKQADGGFSQYLTSCDGASETTFTTTACSLPLSALTSAPYSLIQGQIVRAKIIASNFYGDSAESLEGDGGDNARIVLVPAAPFDLTN